MIDPIKIFQNFRKLNFDPNRPVDFVQIKGNEIKRAVVKPKSLLEQRTDNLQNQMQRVCLLDAPNATPVTLLPQEQRFCPNRRLKLGKVYLPLPEFTVSSFFGFDGGYAKPPTLKRLLDANLNNSHFEIVVSKIRETKGDKISKRELTFGLRNKGLKAKDIQNILDVLVHQYSALQEVEDTQTKSPSVGRKLSQEYLVLWGASKFFPQPSESKEDQE